MAHSNSLTGKLPLQNIGILLGISAQIKDRFLDEYLMEEDITSSQAKALFNIYFREKSRSSDISKALNVDTSTTTRMLDRLEKKGLIQRSPDPDDRRSVMIDATEKGMEVTSRAIPLAEKAIDKLTECLTAEEKKLLHECLMKIVDFHLLKMSSV